MVATGGAASADETTVLIAEDEPEELEVYRMSLAREYDVRTAADGEETVERVDEEVDVVLLDRRMPKVSGDEALERIRELGYDCKMAMVTAVTPDVDLVEMPFDAYLTKPVDRADLLEVVEQLSDVAALDEAVQELFAVLQKRAALEANRAQEALDGTEMYERLTERCEELSAEADEAVEGLDSTTYERMFRDISDSSDLSS